MAGTKAGGLKAAATNKKKYGKHFYANIGREGGKVSSTGGFATKNHRGEYMLAKLAGAIGGKKSRRGKTGIGKATKARIIEALEYRTAGYSTREIADIMQVKEPTVKVWFKREKEVRK